MPCLIRVFLLGLFFGGTGVRGAAAEEEAWSNESNGLQGRLSMQLSHRSNGTGIVKTYLELRNVSNVLGGITLQKTEEAMRFRVTDERGRDVPQPGAMAFDGWIGGSPELVLPIDSSLRFRIGPTGHGVPGDKAAMVDLGPNYCWILPNDGKRYFLQGTLKIAKRNPKPGEHNRPWHGRLDLSPVAIPTRPPPIDPERLGPLIDKLGARMIGDDYDDREEAERELSLIDDPRVIPWYLRAVKLSSYSLRFRALDRLSRMEGDEAFEGLKIGMATRAGDVGNATRHELLESLANNVRHSAAHGLARSPHPEAKQRLLTMAGDPYDAVRIRVVQAAARMKSPEATAVLEQLTRDQAESVAEEATRLRDALRKEGFN